MQKQHIFFIAISFFMVHATYAQNIGIGTENPMHTLSVAGSIAVDHDNTNTGTPETASLLFGTLPSLAAISSSKAPGTSSTNGLDFWTNGERRMMIMEGGTVGINVENPDPNYDLFVGGSIKSYLLHTNNAQVFANLTVGGTLNADSKISINGNPFNSSYRLTVNDGSSYFDGYGHFTSHVDVDGNLSSGGWFSATGNIYGHATIIGDGEVRGAHLRATQYMSVGGSLDPNYRLRVWDGNSRFGGDVQVTGTLNTDDLTTNTINGTGVVRSNGSSPLRIGFSQAGFNTTLNGGSQVDVTANISAFEGGPDDIRVFVSQFVSDPLPQYSGWNHFTFLIHSVNPVNETCKVRITNTSSGQLSIKGVLYLASVAKN